MDLVGTALGARLTWIENIASCLNLAFLIMVSTSAGMPAEAMLVVSSVAVLDVCGANSIFCERFISDRLRPFPTYAL